MKFQYIADYRGGLIRSHLCRLLGVSERGLRAWRHPLPGNGLLANRVRGPPSHRQRRDMVLLAHIRDNADEELYCVPSMSSGAWLPAPLIEARMAVITPVLRLELPADYMFRPRLDQLSLMAPFVEELKAQLEALDLTPQFAFAFDFARGDDLTAGSLMAIQQRLKRVEVLAFELRNMPGAEQKLTKSFMMDMGNQVERRFLINSDSIIITDRAESIECRVKAVPLATLNPFALAAAQSTVAVALTHGTVAGRRSALTVSAAQMMRSASIEQSQNIVEWPLGLTPIPTVGNDQWGLLLN